MPICSCEGLDLSFAIAGVIAAQVSTFFFVGWRLRKVIFVVLLELDNCTLSTVYKARGRVNVRL